MKLTTMKKMAFAASLTVMITSCAQAEGETKTVALDTDEAKASYGIGFGFASNLKQQTAGLDLSTEAMIQGINDAMSSGDMALTEEEIQAAITALQQKQVETQQAEASEKSAAAKEEGEAFLAKNAMKDGVTVTESGLQYEVLTRGDSEERPSAENTVKVHYHGTLLDGTVFDSSVERGEPIEFPLNGVIAGWTEGVQLMAIGDKFRFTIPSDLAYGDTQAGPMIGPGATLVFEVELLDLF